jgi:hypothetical protein
MANTVSPANSRESTGFGSRLSYGVGPFGEPAAEFATEPVKDPIMLLTNWRCESMNFR